MPELSLEDFVQKAQVANLSPEEFQEELKLQYGIDLDTIKQTTEGIQTQVGQVFGEDPEVPPDMREKTGLEEVLEPITTTAGIVAGTTKKLGETLVPTALRDMGIPSAETPGSVQARKDIQERRSDIDALFEERLGSPALQNVRNDLTDNLEGIMEIVRVIRGTEDFTAKDKSTVEHLWGKAEEGAAMGGDLASGLLADITKMGDDPLDYIRSRPITAAMILAPSISRIASLAELGYGPAWRATKSSTYKSAAAAVEAAARKFKGSETGARVTRAAEKTGRAAKEKLHSMKRFVSDPTVQATERASKFVQSLMDEVKKTGLSIEVITKRWAEAVKRGHEEPIVPVAEGEGHKGLRFEAQKTADLLGEGVLKEGWISETGAKVLTQEYDYSPGAKHVGTSVEAKQLIAEGQSTPHGPAIEKMILSQDAKPIEIKVRIAKLSDVVNRFLEDVVKVEGVDKIEALKSFIKNYVDIGSGMLQSDVLRGKVVELAMSKLRESGVLLPDQLIRAEEAITRFIEEMNKRDPSSKSYQNNAVINFGKEPIFDPVTGEIKAVTDPKLSLNIQELAIESIEANPNLRAKIHSELLQTTGTEIAAQARKAKIAQAATEHMGFTTTMSEWIDQNLASLIAGEEMPSAIPQNPHRIAAQLRDAAPTYIKQLAEKGIIATPEQIGEVAFKLQGYKRMPTELAKYFGLEDYLIENRPKPKAGTPAKLANEVFAPEGVISTLDYEMAATLAVTEAKGFWLKLIRGIKGNITVRNVASGLNNIVGNFGYQTYRRTSPFLAANLMSMVTKYHGWRTGKQLVAGKVSPYKINPVEKGFFEAMERTGYLETTVADVELGGIGKSPLMAEVPVIKHITKAKPVAWVNNILEKFYKSGDNIFKLEDAWHNYKKLIDYLEVLKPGQYLKLNVRGKGIQELRRTPRGYTLDGKVITKSQLDDVLASTSSQPGRRVFVDYSDIPNAVKWVRASKALGITSPFFTWMYQVMDIPGFKKGLISELMTDSVSVITNSPELNLRLQASAVATGVKRAAVLAGIREAVIEENNSEVLRKVLAFAPREMNIQLLELTGSPYYIGYDSMEAANQFGPSDMIIRGLMALQTTKVLPEWLGGVNGRDIQNLAKLYVKEPGIKGPRIDFDLSTIKDPELKKEIIIRRKLIKKQLSGEGFTTGDFASLVALSGTPIMDAVIALKEAERSGKSINKARLIQTVTTALMGGTAARALEIGMAALYPVQTRAFTTRKWAENSIGEPQESLIKWGMRRMTGIGFRPLDVATRSKWYWRNKEKEWKASLTGDLREMLDDPELGLLDQDRENINMRIVELEKIVEGEIMLEKIHFDEVYQKLVKQIKKKKR